MKKLLLSTAAAIVALGVAGATAQDNGGNQGQPRILPDQGGGGNGGSPGGGGSMQMPQGQGGGQDAAPGGGAETMPGQQGGDETMPRRQQQGEDETTPRRQQQGEDETTPRRQQQGEDETAPDKQQQGQDETKPDKQQQGRDSDRKKDEATGSVEITSEEKTQIRNSINIERYEVESPDFSVSVGTVIPRTVELHPVPPTLVQIVPAWQAYRIIVVSGNIIIIDPGTYRIVTIVRL